MVLRKGEGIIMNSKRAQWCVVASVALVCAQIVVAQTSADQPKTGTAQVVPTEVMLTRAQWLKKIGEVAKDTKGIRPVMLKISDGEKVEFTQRVRKAITRMPLSPEEKQALLIASAIECIRSTPLKNDERYKVIAEILAVDPVEFLPGVVGELSARFDPKLNKLTDEQFKLMAETTLKLSVERNKSTDEPTVRNTFAILLFLKPTTQPQTENLQSVLMLDLPDDTSRDLAKGWLAEALKGNYEPLLNSAGATVRVTPPPVAVARVGVSQTEQLLIDVGGLTGNLVDRTRTYGENTPYGGMNVFGPSDVGIQTVPLGYPNQLDRLP
jgi:hypothetical protein